MNKTIYEKQFNNHWFNYFKIVAHLPKIYINKNCHDMYTGEDFKITEISFDTSLIISRKLYMYQYGLCIFGFGFSIVRQWSY